MVGKKKGIHLLAACAALSLTLGQVSTGLAWQAVEVGDRPVLESGRGFSVDPEKELIIRRLSVVNDERTKCRGPNPTDCGPWTFGRLMSHIAATDDRRELSDFVLRWLSHWERDLNVNGFLVRARPNIRRLVIDPWQELSGGPDQPLDFGKAPFRLLAIINRMDLRSNGRHGGINAGEGRFVFGLLDLERQREFPSFTVIFEYKLEADSLEDVKDWARAWHELASLPFDTTPEVDDFNSTLQRITDRFSGRNADPDRPNGSSLGQIRTNDFTLAAPWELREFRLRKPFTVRAGNGGLERRGGRPRLVQVPVRGTPDPTLDAGDLLAEFIDLNEPWILQGTDLMPASFRGRPFLAGSARAPFFWTAPAARNQDAVRQMALNTCNGCHTFETGTSFLHVFGRQRRQVSRLSGWVETVDLPRRVSDFEVLLTSTTEMLAREQGTTRVH